MYNIFLLLYILNYLYQSIYFTRGAISLGNKGAKIRIKLVLFHKIENFYFYQLIYLQKQFGDA